MAAITRVITAIAGWQCHRKRTGVGRRRSRCSTAGPRAMEGLQFGLSCHWDGPGSTSAIRRTADDGGIKQLDGSFQHWRTHTLDPIRPFNNEAGLRLLPTHFCRPSHVAPTAAIKKTAGVRTSSVPAMTRFSSYPRLPRAATAHNCRLHSRFAHLRNHKFPG